MMLMAPATDLLVIFLALEMLSLAVYVLTGIRREREQAPRRRSSTSCSARSRARSSSTASRSPSRVAGITRLERIGTALAAQATAPDAAALLAVGLLLVGFAFKVSAVPFHMWTPDAYEGAPTIVTAFMSTGVKAAAFAAFVRVFLSPLEPLQADWMPVLSVIAGATMIVGTVVGVAQTNVKRMLAYSSIAHAGYLLLGLIAANGDGQGARCCSTCWPTPSRTSARFGIVALLGTRTNEHDELRDFAACGTTRPGLAALMTVFLLSLGGFPPTAGFIGKWYIFTAAVRRLLLARHHRRAHQRRLGLLLPAHRRHDVHGGGKREAETPAVSPLATAGLALAVVGIFYLGILPSGIINIALSSIDTIF